MPEPCCSGIFVLWEPTPPLRQPNKIAEYRVYKKTAVSTTRHSRPAIKKPLFYKKSFSFRGGIACRPSTSRNGRKVNPRFKKRDETKPIETYDSSLFQSPRAFDTVCRLSNTRACACLNCREIQTESPLLVWRRSLHSASQPWRSRILPEERSVWRLPSENALQAALYLR